MIGTLDEMDILVHVGSHFAFDEGGGDLQIIIGL